MRHATIIILIGSEEKLIIFRDCVDYLSGTNSTYSVVFGCRDRPLCYSPCIPGPCWPMSCHCSSCGCTGDTETHQTLYHSLGRGFSNVYKTFIEVLYYITLSHISYLRTHLKPDYNWKTVCPSPDFISVGPSHCLITLAGIIPGNHFTCDIVFLMHALLILFTAAGKWKTRLLVNCEFVYVTSNNYYRIFMHCIMSECSYFMQHRLL